ncbi:MAG: UDP-N-acetylmuramate dehydrogenase [Lachnospiraceae bacterium]|nr:UDP-N-acetylmuramate dehydrogenase [Lachnospiraceae bacterium]
MDKAVTGRLEDIIEASGTAARLILNEPLSKHTGFRTGGCADAFIETGDANVIGQILALAHSENVPVYVIGNGSNLLAADEGYRGIIIKMTAPEGSDAISFGDGCTVRVPAGCSLGLLAHECAKKGLTGLEFAAGIPGSVGGAVVMNAGAYGKEIKDVLTLVTVMDRNGTVSVLKAEELKLDYRYSVVPERGWIVLEAVFTLKTGDSEQISGYMAELAGRRREKQPLEYPSAGSIFKRPEGYFAGKLIEDAGLKGFSVGGARVSEKHAGFIINTGGATSDDIMTLIDTVREKVRDRFSVTLEPEVRMLGFDKE